jgi:polar amino acid transport system substrate-binding protein
VRDDAAHALCVGAARPCGRAGHADRLRSCRRQVDRGRPAQLPPGSSGHPVQGVFTFGTDQPAYPPRYIGDNPADGDGLESAIAYAVADKLGYATDYVRWVRVPFNAAITPGPKPFDANLSEFSITEQRTEAVEAVVTVKSSPAAGVHSVDG